MNRIQEFARIFDLPPAMWPHVNYVATDQEIDLVIALGHEAMTVEHIAEMMALGPEEAGEFLARCYTRHIVDRSTEDGITRYTAGTFYERLNPLAMYEAWGDVPAEARSAVMEWELQEFIDKHLPAVQAILSDPDADVRIPNRDVLLLHEALEQVEGATDHVVVICDCRAINMACSREQEACIRLNEGAIRTLDRGMGRRLTKEECKKLVIDLDRHGLMHTGDRDWQKRGELFGFCSCCGCDCYPFLAGTRLGMQQQWPRRHYLPERDEDLCHQCGMCTRRCHFGAFYLDEVDGRVAFDADKCWGCGLCSTACPQSAITMRALAAPPA